MTSWLFIQQVVLCKFTCLLSSAILLTVSSARVQPPSSQSVQDKTWMGQLLLHTNYTDGSVLKVWQFFPRYGTSQTNESIQRLALIQDEQVGRDLSWLQTDLVPPARSDEQGVRLIFDNNRNLRWCTRKPKHVGRPLRWSSLHSVPHAIGMKAEEIDFSSSSMISTACNFFLTRSRSAGLKRTRRNSLFIMPGTKWCGKGNIALDEGDYGAEVETDRCCHAHDRCPVIINSGVTKWNYTNASPTTISHCDCDDIFLTCLQNAGTPIANSVAEIFFNIMQIRCFRRIQKKVCTERILYFCKRYDQVDTVQVYYPQRFQRIPFLRV